MTRSILFVDDERQILKALQRLFIDSPYDIVLMESAESALTFLDSHSIDLIVSDVRMPGMNGFEFLKIVKEKYPDTMRIALSGFTENRAIFKALEANVVKFYMFKPWNNEELRTLIDKMFEIEIELSDKKIKDVINNLDEIPTVPALYSKIRKMIGDDEDVSRIAQLIESDQSSTSKILRIANSAFYGVKTASVNQAILYIGLMSVKSILLSYSVFVPGSPIERITGDIWQNATLTNRFVSEFYQRFLGKRIPNAYATAGLLHNIGMAVLINQKDRSYCRLVEEAVATRSSLLEQEFAHLGVTHQELGGYLLNWWEMPLPVIEAAFFHHAPLDPRVINRELVCTVHIANEYAWRRMGRLEYLDTQPSLAEACCEFLQVNYQETAAYFAALPLEDTLLI